MTGDAIPHVDMNPPQPGPAGEHMSETLHEQPGIHSSNFQFPKVPTVGVDVLKNNVSHNGPVTINGTAQLTANSWQGFTVTDADFASVDATTATAPRNADYSLPTLAFLHGLPEHCLPTRLPQHLRAGGGRA